MSERFTQALEAELQHFFNHEPGVGSPGFEIMSTHGMNEAKPPELPKGADFWIMATVWDRLRFADGLMPRSERRPAARDVLCAHYGPFGEIARGSSGEKAGDRDLVSLYPLTGCCPVARDGMTPTEGLAKIRERIRQAKGPERTLWRDCARVSTELLSDARTAYQTAALAVAAYKRATPMQRLMRRLDAVLDGTGE